MVVGERQVIRSLEAVAMEALQEVEAAMAAQVEEDMELPQVDFQVEDTEELPVPVLVEDLVAKCRCSNAALCRSKSARMSRDNNARQ